MVWWFDVYDVVYVVFCVVVVGWIGDGWWYVGCCVCVGVWFVVCVVCGEFCDDVVVVVVIGWCRCRWLILIFCWLMVVCLFCWIFWLIFMCCVVSICWLWWNWFVVCVMVLCVCVCLCSVVLCYIVFGFCGVGVVLVVFSVWCSVVKMYVVLIILVILWWFMFVCR